MALLTILQIGAAAFYFYLFIVVQRMKVRRHEHALLSLSTIALFQWALTAYFIYHNDNPQVLQILIPVSCIGMIFFAPLNMHFVYTVCFHKALPKAAFAGLYSTALLLSILNFFSPFAFKIVQSPAGEPVLQQAFDTPLHFVWMAFYTGNWILPIYFYFRYGKRATLTRKKKQARLLVRVMIFTIIIALSEYYLTPFIPGWNLPPQSPVLFSPWIAAMVYAIWKYGFLRISPDLMANEILDSIEDLVILYDMNAEGIYRNRKAAGIMGDARISPAGDTQLIDEMVRPLLQTSSRWTANEPERHVTLRVPHEQPSLDHPGHEHSGHEHCGHEQSGLGHSGHEHPILNRPGHEHSGGAGSNIIAGRDSIEIRKLTVSFRVKPILDHFGDPLGVLVSGTILPKFSDFLENYGLTPREAEVLEYLIAGWTIGKTAELLYITERTVKAHITNIYEKTGAANRVELVNMLGSMHMDTVQN